MVYLVALTYKHTSKLWSFVVVDCLFSETFVAQLKNKGYTLISNFVWVNLYDKKRDKK